MQCRGISTYIAPSGCPAVVTATAVEHLSAVCRSLWCHPYRHPVLLPDGSELAHLPNIVNVLRRWRNREIGRPSTPTAADLARSRFGFTDTDSAAAVSAAATGAATPTRNVIQRDVFVEKLSGWKQRERSGSGSGT